MYVQSVSYYTDLQYKLCRTFQELVLYIYTAFAITVPADALAGDPFIKWINFNPSMDI